MLLFQAIPRYCDSFDKPVSEKGKVPIFVSQSNLVSIANRTIAHGMDLQRLTEAIYWIVKVLFLSSCQIKGHVFDVLQFLSEVFRRRRVCF